MADGLLERLQAGPVMVLDGGTGTELEKRGVPMDKAAWSAAALATHPDVVRQVHEDYIRAGAELVIANTFGASRQVLEHAGMGERFAELNARAVELARQARERAAHGPVWVAGALSTTTFTGALDYHRLPPPDQARAVYREQADILARAGADLIVLEMMRDAGQTLCAVQGARDTGLPVWVGFSVERGGDGTVFLVDMDMPLEPALERVAVEPGVQAVGVMHSQVEDTAPALEVVRRHWAGPMYAYPHRGLFEMPRWRFIDTIAPAEFADRAREWVSAGARAVGGCCGTSPEHVAALRRTFPLEG